MKNIKWLANFPWKILLTGMVLLVFSVAFKAYDMALICIIPVIGSFLLFVYNCVLDIRITKNKMRPKKNVCLLIGCPGSGAKSFLEEYTNFQNEYSEILFYEGFFKAQLDIKGLFSLDTPIDTFLIYGYLGREGDARDWKDFLTRIPIKYNYKHPLNHYVPDAKRYMNKTVVKLTKKDDYWLLQKLQGDNHEIMY